MCMDDLTIIDAARLADYFAGELTPEDMVVVDRWLIENPEWKEFTSTLTASRLTASRIDVSAGVKGDFEDNAAQVATLKESLASTLSAERNFNKSVRRTTAPSRGWSHLKTRAAYVMGAVVASLCFVFIGWRLSEESRGISASTAVSTYSTDNGERATVVLVDGSTVVLNVASTLEVPENYGNGNRALRLTGEALFKINSKKGDPFTVETNGVTTKVLGTTFIVRHYKTDTTTKVAVNDGKVAVDSLVVSAGEQIVVNTSGGHQVSSVSDTRSIFTSGILIIEPQSLSNAINDLQRWYNVEIKFGDVGVSNRRISGQFAIGSMIELKEILESTFGIRVERSERILTLHSR